VSEVDKLRLIYDLYWCLINHPPLPELFEMRTRLLSQAYELVGHMEERYDIPSED
jgi:hypothetical protein